MTAAQIRTPRLLLKQLLSNNPDSQDLEYYHRVWSDGQATQWSLHPTSQTLQDSQDWMAGVIPWQNVPESNGRITFAVLRPATQKKAHGGTTSIPGPQKSFDDGEFLDSRNDWETAGILTLLPVKQPASPTAEEIPASTATPQKRTAELGYLFVPESWGLGYATESIEALLEWYSNDINSAAGYQKPETVIEANVHPENKGSIRVLDKLGFRQTGRTDGEDIVYLGNAERKNCVVHFQRRL